MSDLTANPVEIADDDPLAAETRQSSRSRFFKRLRRNRLALAAGGVLVLLALMAIFAPWIAPDDPNLANRFQDILFPPGEGGYVLGTDQAGRDILSRIIFGTRYALLAGIVAVSVALGIGIPLGLTIGYFRGWVDRIAMRFVETVVAVPAVVMAMAIIAALGPGLVRAMFAIGVVYSMIITRLTRAEVFAAREELYVDGARSAGAGSNRIMWRHVLPNIAPALIVQTTLLFATAVLAEAALSFLGLGAKPSSQASWGVMLQSAQLSLDRTIWPAIPPGVMVFITVVAFNVFGDGLRDAFAREARGGRIGIGDVEPVPLTDPTPQPDGAVLSVRNLSVRFPRPGTTDDVDVVQDVSFDIGRGKILALVGESGSGKSITALSLLGLVPDPGQAAAASIRLEGRELVGLDFDELRPVRGKDIGVIFQEPFAALNPSHTIGRQIAEPMRVHLGLSKAEARQRAIELMERVGIPDPTKRIDAYPHQFSGGMAQRVVIAMALSCEPKLLIADEPTTALDVTVQGQVLDLISDLSSELGVAVLLITHDLGVVADLADDVAVMYAGQVVESGRLTDVFHRPQHPYTEGLIRAIPRNERRTTDLPTIAGVVPPPWLWPQGCHFAPRCGYATDSCRATSIELQPSELSLARCMRTSELQLEGVVRDSVVTGLGIDPSRTKTKTPSESGIA
jgi:peptide/nickel transport system permease protein